MLSETGSVFLILACYNCVLGVARLRSAQKSLYREQGRPDSEGWGPLVAEDVEADDPSLGGNVGVPNFSVKFHDRGLKGVLVGQLDVDLEESALIGAVFRPINIAFPVFEVTL